MHSVCFMSKVYWFNVHGLPLKTRNSKFANWFWSHSARIGRKKAIIAVARKLLVTIIPYLKPAILVIRWQLNNIDLITLIAGFVCQPYLSTGRVTFPHKTVPLSSFCFILSVRI